MLRLCFTTSFTDSTELFDSLLVELELLSSAGETLEDLLSEQIPLSGLENLALLAGTFTGHARATTILNVFNARLLK